MRLFEHPDFDQAVIQAAEHFEGRGLRPALIEKDYFISEVLRTVAAAVGDKVIFKGGTSLSKGWGLIERFSEDIDLFLDPEAYQQRLSTRGVDRELRRLRDAVGSHPGLTFDREQSQTIGGFGRHDRFRYLQRFPEAGVVDSILLEVGTASGREPTEDVRLCSYVGQFLEETGRSLETEDEEPFSLRLLHFRRTFVEKMFAIHSKIQLLLRQEQPLGSYARHYYDLFQLAGRQEVLDMLSSDEYATIKEDYDQISRARFPRS